MKTTAARLYGKNGLWPETFTRPRNGLWMLECGTVLLKGGAAL
jgi:hypothetical protein